MTPKEAEQFFNQNQGSLWDYADCQGQKHSGLVVGWGEYPQVTLLPPNGMVFLEFDPNVLSNLQKLSLGLFSLLVSERSISRIYSKVNWVGGLTPRGNSSTICLLATTDQTRLFPIPRGLTSPMGAPGCVGPTGHPGLITPITANSKVFTPKEAETFFNQNVGAQVTYCEAGWHYTGTMVGYFSPSLGIHGPSGVTVLFQSSVIAVMQKNLATSYRCLGSKDSIDGMSGLRSFWDPNIPLSPVEINLGLCNNPSCLSVLSNPPLQHSLPPIIPPISLNQSFYHNFKDWDKTPEPSKPKDISHYPHKCPRCGGAAYVGIGPRGVDCSNENCLCFRKND